MQSTDHETNANKQVLKMTVNYTHVNQRQYRTERPVRIHALLYLECLPECWGEQTSIHFRISVTDEFQLPDENDYCELISQ